MALNYDRRLQNLQNRRFDSRLNESALSKSFSTSDLPKNMKYLIESMMPIEKTFAQRTIEAATNVQNHLENAYSLHFGRAYRRQGSVETNTNIRIYSDVDLLNIINRYYFLAPSLPNPDPYRDSDPDEDIKEMRKQALKILKGIYDEVDDSNEKCISILNKNLKIWVDVVFAYWYNTEDYERFKSEYYRGVKIKSRSATPDFPFAHISRVQDKGDLTQDGSRRGIRLLKTLKEDSETKIHLVKSFHLTTVVHSIDNTYLFYQPGNDINIAQAISDKLYRIINDPEYRKSIKSPNGCEQPLTNDELVKELRLIKADLDDLIFDAKSEINTGYTVKNLVKLYS